MRQGSTDKVFPSIHALLIYQDNVSEGPDIESPLEPFFSKSAFIDESLYLKKEQRIPPTITEDALSSSVQIVKSGIIVTNNFNNAFPTDEHTRRTYRAHQEKVMRIICSSHVDGKMGVSSKTEYPCDFSYSILGTVHRYKQPNIFTTVGDAFLPFLEDPPQQNKRDYTATIIKPKIPDNVLRNLKQLRETILPGKPPAIPIGRYTVGPDCTNANIFLEKLDTKLFDETGTRRKLIQTCRRSFWSLALCHCLSRLTIDPKPIAVLNKSDIEFATPIIEAALHTIDILIESGGIELLEEKIVESISSKLAFIPPEGWTVKRLSKEINQPRQDIVQEVLLSMPNLQLEWVTVRSTGEKKLKVFGL